MANKSLDSYHEDEILELYENFLDQVEEEGYQIIPTRSKFAKSLGVRPSEMYRWLNLHNHASAKMKAMTADVIASGAMLKHYVPNASAMALKNWCGWEDSPKTSKEKDSKSAKAEKDAEKLLDEYIGEKRLKVYGQKKRSHVG